jgi:hypothetical protein
MLTKLSNAARDECANKQSQRDKQRVRVVSDNCRRRRGLIRSTLRRAVALATFTEEPEKCCVLQLMVATLLMTARLNDVDPAGIAC